MHVQKWYPYEEAVKVPLVFSCPARLPQGKRDAAHLVSGIDVMPTMCDYAGIEAPPHTAGRSLRPLLEGRPAAWREFVVAATHLNPARTASAGHTIRTERYKYVRYAGDPVEQLFDMKADPWETKNLFGDPKCADVVQAHRKLLEGWQAGLRPVPATPESGIRRRRRRPRGPRPGKKA